jgi:ornithine cyclodeaminase
MQFISAEDVHRLLDYPTLVEALRLAHRQPCPAVGEAYLDEPGAAGSGRGFLTLPAWQRDVSIGVKLVSVFPGNPSAAVPRPANQGVYVGFDGKTGAPSFVADGTALTLRKTAADSALGIDILSRPDAHTLLVLGAGALVPHVIAATLSVRPSIRRVEIWNRTAEKAAAVAQSLAIDNVEINATTDLNAALAKADIVSAATMATEPLVAGRLLKEGCHVDLIGGWRPDMRECDDDTIRRAVLFADARLTCRNCGDFLQPIERGLMSWADIHADLFELCSGEKTGRTSPGEITLFKNAGGGHLDLFTADALIARFQAVA